MSSICILCWPWFIQYYVLSHCPLGMWLLSPVNHSQTHLRGGYHENFLWLCPQVNTTRPHWWFVNTDSGKGLMLLGNKSLPGQGWPTSLKPYGVTWPQWVNGPCCQYGDVIMSMMASQITGVSIVCSNICCRSKKTSKLHVTGEENLLLTGRFPSQRANNTQNFSLWGCCHVMRLNYMHGSYKCSMN